MNKCKSCIYYDRCKHIVSQWGIDLDTATNTCDDFKEKSTKFEPLCKVGDTVYAYCKEVGHALEYFVEQITIDYDTENPDGYWTFYANSSNEGELLDSIDFTADEIGKSVFLKNEDINLKGIE